jgi:predicted  nucleic acid-binding Zn-ribbon protein
MNKTLLLIIVDFLFLNLIALTRWERAEPAQPRINPVTQVGANATPRQQDLVAVMRLALTDEQASREKVTAQLQATRAELQAREQHLAAVQSAQAAAESSLAASRQDVQELNQRVAVATQDATVTRERLARLQRDLEAKQAEAAQQQKRIAQLAQDQAEAQQRIEGLNVAVKVAQQERTLLADNLQEAKQQIVAERQERQKMLAQTDELAAGVGQLAQKSGEIVKEIRNNRPINANVLFSDFLANRVTVALTVARKGLFGMSTRTKESDTVLVTDGRAVYALLHTNDTPFVLGPDVTPVDWERVSVRLSRPDVSAPAGELQFLSLDPRLIAIPVDADLAARLGVKVYPTALEPFKFPQAMLVSHGGQGYGSVDFKLDARMPQYVRMDNRLIRHLAGDFTPSSGDLVFSQTGELLGIMVNSDYCAVINNFLPAQTIRTGDDTRDEHTGQIQAAMSARLQALPLRLQ